MTAYYNEFDPYVAEWLRNLIAAGHIPPGDVDERDIRDVLPRDLQHYTQCHFFAGIGGWPLALRLARWPDARPVWTGSCPCQPFSAAGQRKGTSDERHLWPEFFRLIKACRPPVIFGEQVASAEVVGTELEASFVVAVQSGDFARANKLSKRLAQSRSFHFHPRWIDGVRTDVEAVDYTFWHAVLGAHSTGAPHIRQRLWWVAERHFGRAEGGARRVADSDGGQPRHGELQSCGKYGQQPEDGGAGRMGHADDERPQGRRLDAGEHADQRTAWEASESRWLEHAAGEQVGISGCAREPRGTDFWSAYDIVPCADGKARRVEPGTFPLAHGIPARVGKLRAYGNAIVPQVAAEFVTVYLETHA